MDLTRNKYLTLIESHTVLSSNKFKILLEEDNYFLIELNKQASNYIILTLSTQTVERALSRMLADKFNHNTNVYDKAIDAIYNKTRIGGSILHHNLDGAHYFSGGMQILRENFPEDSDFHLAIKLSEHYLKDLTTPSGINPFLSPDDFNALKEFFVRDLHLSKSFVNDLLNINAIELGAVVLAAYGLSFDLNEKQLDKLGEYISRFSLSGLWAGNPLMIVLSSILIGQSIICLWNGQDIINILEGASRGLVNASSFLLATLVFSGPILLGTLAGISCALITSYFYEKALDIFSNNIDGILKQQFSNYKTYIGII